MQTVQETVDVAPVWAGHPVGFALLTRGQDQFVAYYDEHRRMTFVQRKLGQSTWRRCRPEIVDDHPPAKDGRTPTHVGWDSHNYLAIALDSAGHLHAAGNMHGHPLVYFRASRPADVTSLEFFPHMVGDHEQRVSYPRFWNMPDGRLIFTYHDGPQSGGQELANVYGAKVQQWVRLLGPAPGGVEPMWHRDKKAIEHLSGHPPEDSLPAELSKPESATPGTQVNTLRDGDYLLRWETLPPNRDKPREGPPSPPSMLRVIHLVPSPPGRGLG